MKTLAFLNKVICVLIVSIVLIFSIQTEAVSSNQECKWVPVDPNSFAGILTMVGERVRENHNKLSTWQGKIKIVTDSIDRGAIAERTFREELKNDEQPIPNIIIEHYEFTREFALDVNKEMLYEHHYPDRPKHHIMDADTGRELQLKKYISLGSVKNILTSDYQIHCGADRVRVSDGVAFSRMAVKQARPEGKLTCKSGMHPVFDPRETMRVFGNPLWKAFASYLAYIDKHGPSSTFQGYTMKVEVEECNVGDVKKYKIVLPSVSSGGPKVYLSSTLICSSEAGFNVVSYSQTADYDKILEHKTWNYGLINGVYIPVKQTKKSFDYLTGNLNKQSTLTFIEQKVNKSIPEEVFTYKNLGLKNGDKFIDKILGKEYIYQDGELIPADKKK